MYLSLCICAHVHELCVCVCVCRCLGIHEYTLASVLIIVTVNQLLIRWLHMNKPTSIGI